MSLLIESAIKVTLLAGAGLFAATLLRGRSAALRHWVLAATLTAALATPLMILAGPSWSLPVDVAATQAGGSTSTIVSFAPVAGTVAPAESARTGPTSGGARPDAVTVAVTVWLTGLALYLAGLSAGLWRLRRIAARATRVDSGPWRAAARTLAGRYGLRRPVRLLRSREVALPVTWGFVEPGVLLPADADSYPPERIHVVLAHELAHVKRGDWIVQMAGEVLRAIYWFNPLLWATCARLRLESERACDDAVVGLGVQGGDYAVHLLELARQFGGSPRRRVPAVAMVSRPSSLERRISAMLNPDLNRRPLSALGRLGILGFLLVVALPIALFAQNTFATLSGSITDESGGLLPGVFVVASDLERGVRHEVRTSGAGRFELIGLPQGAYRLDASLPGFQTYQHGLTLAGQDVAEDVTLKIGSLQETIVVTSEPGPPKALPRPVRPATDPGCERNSFGPNVLPDGGRRVGGQIKQPLKIRHVSPVYPAGSAPGTVRMDAVIGVDGFVQEVTVGSATSPELVQAAEDAVRQWQFTPTLLNCVPVDVRMSVLVEFR